MQRIHLLSCGSCRRQLDVTALQIGDVVQCVCDTVLTVPPPREVQIRGLACSRCGGAIGENDESCSFCTAKLSAEGREQTLLCPLCTKRLPNDSRHCKACGVELRVSAVPPLPRGGKCPRCDGPLRVHLMEDAEVIECSLETGCGGLWCSRETFTRLQRNAHKAALLGAAATPDVTPVSPLGAPEGAKRQYVPCLACGEFMQRQQFRIAGRSAGIVLDVCRLHGVWFDEDELEAALAFVRSRMQLGDPLGAAPGSTLLRTRDEAQNSNTEASRRTSTGASVGASFTDGIFGMLLESIGDVLDF